MRHSITPGELAQCIDHTILSPTATEAQVEAAVSEAIEYQFRTICLEKKWLKTVAPRLAGKSVIPITVISFPGGDHSTSQKVSETREAVMNGAREIDMVLNRKFLFDFEYGLALEDIQAVVKAAGVPVKVILETSELTPEQKSIACALSKAAGASYVKTSTGFTKSGATVEDIQLFRKVVGPLMGVKASGGIRTLKDALKMIEAGATRLGCSASVAIIRELTGAAAEKGSGY